MYVWAEIPGYSKFGSYSGNGSSDGTFVFTGFKPALVISKRSDSNDKWILRDAKRNSFNDVYYILNANATDSEFGSSGFSQAVDFVSNGFKIRGTDGGTNSSSGTYIYMAWAEEPGTTPFDTFPNAR